LTGRRALLIAVLVLAAMAGEPGGSLSALLPDVADEAPGFRAAGSPIRADDDRLTFTSRRDGLDMTQAAGPGIPGAAVAAPIALAGAGSVADAPGRSIAVQRR